jgi:hypothetical protein
VSASPLDSQAKRAAFALFYGPLHFLTVRQIVRAVGAGDRPFETLIDLGCGTGVVSAAWALESDRPPLLHGVDALGWAVEEAAWTWRTLGLAGRARRGDLVRAAAQVASSARGGSLDRTGVIAGWSLNELSDADRTRLLPICRTLRAEGARVLLVEPIARRATPWWSQWADAITADGGRNDEWAFDAEVPAPIAALSQEAGFRRDRLTARSLWL